MGPPWAVRLGLHPPYPGGSFDAYLDPDSRYYRADAATAFAPWRGAQHAAEAEYREARERSERARADEADRRWQIRTSSLAVLNGRPQLSEALDALSASHGGLPRKTCEATLARFIQLDVIRPTHEIVVAEGRMTVPGYFLSRGTFTTQLGRWKEVRRVPAFRAPQADRRRVGDGEYGSPAREKGFDVWLDVEGGLWCASDRRAGNTASNFAGGKRSTRAGRCVSPTPSVQLGRTRRTPLLLWRRFGLAQWEALAHPGGTAAEPRPAAS